MKFPRTMNRRTVLRAGVESIVEPGDLALGDRLLLRPGERLATDGVIRHGGMGGSAGSCGSYTHTALSRTLMTPTTRCTMWRWAFISWTTSSGTSANYSLVPDAVDSGGLRGTSASYSLNASAMAGGAGASPIYTTRTGFAGQLEEPVSGGAVPIAIRITALPANPG